jgi:FKBP-type peptidyl-prolyl cis-trans isomerase FklB
MVSPLTIMTRQASLILTVGLLVGVASAWGQSGGITVKTNTSSSATPSAAPPPAGTNDLSKIFKNEQEKFSYALGMSWGAGLKERLKRQNVEIDMDAFAKGFRDNLGNGQSLMTEGEEREVINQYDKELKAMQKAKADRAEADGQAFLAKNKTSNDVVTLPSGLQYKIITEGKGESPKPEDEVTVNYKGMLLDGTEFDSSYKRGQPATFKVTGVIKGWTEALELMKPGAKWELFIPSSLAYGPNPPPRAGIPPNSMLIFEVELVSAKHGAPPPTAGTPPPAPSIHPANVPLTSDIIKVPSEEERKKGAQIETIKAEDLEKEKAKAAAASTNK